MATAAVSMKQGVAEKSRISPKKKVLRALPGTLEALNTNVSDNACTHSTTLKLSKVDTTCCQFRPGFLCSYKEKMPRESHHRNFSLEGPKDAQNFSKNDIISSPFLLFLYCLY